MAVDLRTKMVICEIRGRKHVPISWATGDGYALQVMTAIACEKPIGTELYWRTAHPGEIKRMEQDRKLAGVKKLPGW